MRALMGTTRYSGRNRSFVGEVLDGSSLESAGISKSRESFGRIGGGEGGLGEDAWECEGEGEGVVHHDPH